METRAVRWLHPERAIRRPALFLLEVAAALFTVLALRDELLFGAPPPLETLFALGLWGALLVFAYFLAPPERRDMGNDDGSTRPL